MGIQNLHILKLSIIITTEEGAVVKIFIRPNEEECNIVCPIGLIKTDDGSAQPNEDAKPKGKFDMYYITYVDLNKNKSWLDNPFWGTFDMCIYNPTYY